MLGNWMARKIFFSIGTPTNEKQHKIFDQISEKIKTKGLSPVQPQVSGKAPLINVRDTLDECVGMIVVAYPRLLVKEGFEKGNTIFDTPITTPWNHIEAAFAYDRGLPIIIFCDEQLKIEGFLEHSYDWRVQRVLFNEEFLKGENFDSMLDEFDNQVNQYIAGDYKRFPNQEVKVQGSKSIKTVGGLISNLTIEVFIQILFGLGALFSAGFFLGKLFV